jgi:hypothetical protein
MGIVFHEKRPPNSSPSRRGFTVRQLSSTEGRPSRTRLAVTNGRRAFVDGDGNSAWYRRRKDIIELHLDDMGGRDALSEAQISLACRAASIEVELEQMEGRLSKGESVDLDTFTRAAGHLRRILETLGIERRQRDVTPSLDAIIAEHAKETPS